MRNLSHSTEDKLVFLERQDTSNRKLALFIHGFEGDYITTWGNLGEYLRYNSDTDLELQDWDFLFLGYQTSNVQTYLDIANLIASMWRRSQDCIYPFNHKYNQLALFGHSLGTLGIRQLLCSWKSQPEGMMDAVKSVTLFGTPLNGSYLANIFNFSTLLRYGWPISSALQPNNPQLRMLRNWSEGAYSKLPWPGVYIILGLDDKVVGYSFDELINWPGDNPPETTNLDHGNLVKPEVWGNSQVLGYIKRGLR